MDQKAAEEKKNNGRLNQGQGHASTESFSSTMQGAEMEASEGHTGGGEQGELHLLIPCSEYQTLVFTE